MSGFGSLMPMQFAAPQMKSGGLGAQGASILAAALGQQKKGGGGILTGPGGLLDFNNTPVNPGVAPPAGSPVYVPGGEGPAAPVGGGGMPAPPQGLLGQLLAKMRGGGGVGMPGGLAALLGNPVPTGELPPIY